MPPLDLLALALGPLAVWALLLLLARERRLYRRMHGRHRELDLSGVAGRGSLRREDAAGPLPATAARAELAAALREAELREGLGQ